MKREESEALRKLKPVVKDADSSPMREMMKMMEEKEDLIGLSAGEANFDPPGELINMATEAMRKGKNKYTSTNGIPQVREAVAAFLKDQWGADVDPDQNILMTVGGMEAIYLAARIVLEPGDRVLLPDPGWGVMRTLVERLGALVDYYPLREEKHWLIDPEAILSRMDEDTKLVVVNTPSNPTGAVLSREGFEALIEKAEGLGTFILSDEVYHSYVYDGEHASGLSFGCLDNLIFVNSFSKAFAVTGWRLGYAIAHPWIIRQMGIFKESISLCSFSIGQWAMSEFLPHGKEYLRKARDFCRKNMERLVEGLNAIPGVKCTPPMGGIYVFPDFSEIEPSSQALFKRLLDAGVAVAPGAFFGTRGEGHSRLMFACPTERIEKGLERIRLALKG